MSITPHEIRERLQEKNLKLKDFAKEIGYHPSTLSNWLNHDGIPKEVESIISEKLDIELAQEFEPEVEKVTIQEAAGRLGMSCESVMMCMRQNAFPYPIGVCWKARNGEQWNYRIIRGMLEKAISKMK